ncbi:MAG: cob(I)yrinic acid a,c-diamide adenosyltransferase [Candidatus Micrarchaeota archaeon]|nr:cob(I)yrinic acid a,c-diamide adenosyltransferase [Candidatus Micrarchaeota archaeon]MDE1864175.1 cob(I)yrinic acid a,c-diamide adenosyltransferase [Candidatus Micrarchaeota archaeon]
MTKYYTGKGDNGSTSIMGGTSVPKGDILIEAIGDVDELNSSIGISLFYVRDDTLREQLKLIQNELFSIGALLASVESANFSKAKVEPKQVQRLEEAIKSMGAKMPELTKFVLPAGSEESSHIHLSRSIARRAERHISAAAQKYKIDGNLLAYMNRLSSFLFTAALYLNFQNGVEESNPMY